MPVNRDEKGRISPAQSKVAKAMGDRKPLLPMTEHQRSMLGQTMGGMAKEQEERFNYSKVLRKDPAPGRYNYGGTTRAKHHEKLKVIARGKRDEFRKGYTQGMKKLKEGDKARGFTPEVKHLDRLHKYAKAAKRQKLETVLRGQKNEYRKAYTKVGARMHKTGALKAPE